MMTGIARFNINLCAALALAVTLTSGCTMMAKHKEAKKATTLTFNLETDPDGLSEIKAIKVGRSSPVAINVNKEPFLDSGDVQEAKVIDDPGGLYSIRLKFNTRGTVMLDSVTSGNPGKRLGIYCVFGDKQRWIACPLVRRPINNGVLTFVPDATREECDRIVLGLNNIAKEMKDENKHDTTL